MVLKKHADDFFVRLRNGIGRETPEYFAMLAHLDRALGRIVQAVDDAGMMDETVFILAADHGGIHTGHGGKTMEEMQTAIIFSGKGVKPACVPGVISFCVQGSETRDVTRVAFSCVMLPYAGDGSRPRMNALYEEGR